jgi:hypothetical protein
MKLSKLFGLRSAAPIINEDLLYNGTDNNDNVSSPTIAITPLTSTTTSPTDAFDEEPKERPRVSFKSILPKKANKETAEASKAQKSPPPPLIADMSTLEYKTLVYEVEGVGKFEYTGMVDQNGHVSLVYLISQFSEMW